MADSHLLRFAGLDRKHWNAVSAIYRDGIATRDATFETEVPSWDRWDSAHLRFGRLVALVREEVAAWAALSPISDRCAYAGVAEVSVYVGSRHRRMRIGSRLLEQIVNASEANGVWTLQAGIFPENEASVSMHLERGFRLVGRRERLGRLEGRWRDVLLLERRSRVVGVD